MVCKCFFNKNRLPTSGVVTAYGAMSYLLFLVHDRTIIYHGCSLMKHTIALTHHQRSVQDQHLLVHFQTM